MDWRITLIYSSWWVSPLILSSELAFNSLLINRESGTHCPFLFLPTLDFRLINRLRQTSFKNLTLSTWIYITRMIKKEQGVSCASPLLASTKTSLGWSQHRGPPSTALSPEVLEPMSPALFVEERSHPCCSSVLVSSLGSFWKYVKKSFHLAYYLSPILVRFQSLEELTLPKWNLLAVKNAF